MKKPKHRHKPKPFSVFDDDVSPAEPGFDPGNPRTWPAPEGWPLDWYGCLLAAMKSNLVFSLGWPPPEEWEVVSELEPDPQNWFLTLSEPVWERVNNTPDPINLKWPAPPGWPEYGVNMLVVSLVKDVGQVETA